MTSVCDATNVCSINRQKLGISRAVEGSSAVTDSVSPSANLRIFNRTIITGSGQRNPSASRWVVAPLNASSKLDAIVFTVSVDGSNLLGTVTLLFKVSYDIC